MEMNYWAGKNRTKLQDVPDETTSMQALMDPRFATLSARSAASDRLPGQAEGAEYPPILWKEIVEESLRRIREVVADELCSQWEQLAAGPEAALQARAPADAASELVANTATRGLVPARVLAIEEHPLFSEALRMLFQYEHAFELVDQAEDRSVALSLVATLRPDIVVLAIALPAHAELDLVTQINRVHAESRTVVITNHQDGAYLARALQVGVHAVITSRVTGTDLLGVLQAVKRGERVLMQPEALNTLLSDYGQLLRERERERFGLTEQEIQILRLAADGLNNKDIGAQQFWSEITIKRKMQDIYRKLEVRSRAQAVAEAIRLGII